ncbi:MAG: hypothetical protein ACRDNS_10610, partial [Trebonia sp.]
MSLTRTPLRPAPAAKRSSFGSVVWAEWVKLRTVRGWILALIFGAAAMLGLCYEVAAGPHTGGCSGLPQGAVCTSARQPVIPTGPDGEAVADTYEFVHHSFTGDGTVTARIAALTGVVSMDPANVQGSLSSSRAGLAPWAKAGFLLTPTTKQGSTYAAIMATGSHGVHFQYDYTDDTAGAASSTAASSPWLRLARSGNTITGYTSGNGQQWTKVGSVRLSGLPPTLQVGLFTTSPVVFHGSTGYPSLATATFDQITVNNAPADATSWVGQDLGTGRDAFYPMLGNGSDHQSGGSVVVSGSGDIAPAVVQGLAGTHTASGSLLLGLIVGLLVVIVVAAMFVTAEYRRGLIRTTFSAIPNRGRVLVAKGAVVGAVSFVLSAIALAIVVPLGEHLLRSHGNYVFPATTSSEVRIVLGASAVIALAAVTVIALAAIVRRPAAAITVGAAVFLLPTIVAAAGGGSAATWVLRLTPAAGLSMLGALIPYHQVSYSYTVANGYYPLSPLAGLAVLCGYT